MKKNRKKVSIIIPFYGQTEQDLSVPLASINNQLGVDFDKIDVHLVNDGGDSIDIGRFDIFSNLDLHYHELLENVGAGMARQYGIDHSESEYLMFMDSDDSFNGVESLYNFFDAAKQKHNPNIIEGKSLILLDDSKTKFSYRFSNFGSNGLFAHWFKRSYIEKLNLRFQPELRIFEDQYFVGIAKQLNTESLVSINALVYVYRFRKDSLSEGRKVFYKFAEQNVLKYRLQLQYYQTKLPQDKFNEQLSGALIDLFLNFKNFSVHNKDLFFNELEKLAVAFPKLPEELWNQMEEGARRRIQVKELGYGKVDSRQLKPFLKELYQGKHE